MEANSGAKENGADWRLCGTCIERSGAKVCSGGDGGGTEGNWCCKRWSDHDDCIDEGILCRRSGDGPLGGSMFLSIIGR